jgi:hypothetical protein
MTRDEVISRLFDNDLNDIIQGHQDGDNSYLRDILYCGMKGYEQFTNKELEEEYDAQEFDDTPCKITE